MDMKGFVFAAIGVFIFVCLYEFLVHGFLMMSQYQQTANLWRPQEESRLTVMLLSQFLFAVAVAFFYPLLDLIQRVRRPFRLLSAWGWLWQCLRLRHIAIYRSL